MQDSCGQWIKESMEQIYKWLQALNEDQTLQIFHKVSVFAVSSGEVCFYLFVECMAL